MWHRLAVQASKQRFGPRHVLRLGVGIPCHGGRERRSIVGQFNTTWATEGDPGQYRDVVAVQADQLVTRDVCRRCFTGEHIISCDEIQPVIEVRRLGVVIAILDRPDVALQHFGNLSAANVRVAHDDAERRNIFESFPHAGAQHVLATNNNREARAGKQTSTECKQTLMLMLNDANFDFSKIRLLARCHRTCFSKTLYYCGPTPTISCGPA